MLYMFWHACLLFLFVVKKSRGRIRRQQASLPQSQASNSDEVVPITSSTHTVEMEDAQQLKKRKRTKQQSSPSAKKHHASVTSAPRRSERIKAIEHKV